MARSIRWLVIAALAFTTTYANAQGFAPDVAASKMTAADGLAVRLVAAEPHVRQPVCIEFDDRGRLWVLQYLQYPNPAGLKRVKVDRYSRTVYDRAPEPPPRGAKGADRLTILEDADGDGRVDRSKDFISGLNIATGFAFGYGGVFVLNAPYLLFYADRNRDDVPDGDPEVLLSGFGLEDTSSLVNSLTWGPDGWLYGNQGTNITARIRGVEFEQGVWRYHPLTRDFELFSEGGGNSWGLDFDQAGNLFCSTNYGGFVTLHAMQGAYYAKSFQKHGELHNPYAFGYFDHAPHKNFQGGHVTVGGTFYDEPNLPPQYQGKFIAADLLGHAVRWHEIKRTGSTFRSENGGELLQANDSWFAPSDLITGPDGAIYVSDWHDKRTGHPDPDADWDRSNGRVYRIGPAVNSFAAALPNFAQDSSASLVETLADPGTWSARRALRTLAERRDHSVIPDLRQRLAAERDERKAPRWLWALYVSGGFDEARDLALLDHAVEPVRAWTVRFLGDQRQISTATELRLLRLARNERSPAVLAQLACSARRLPAKCGLRLLRALADNPVSADDPRIPLLTWWGIETHALADREFVIATFASSVSWNNRLLRDTILPRLLKRYAAEGTSAGWSAVAKLMQTVPAAERSRFLAELDEGIKLIGVQHARELPLGASYTRYATVSAASSQRPGRLASPPPELGPLVATLERQATADPAALRVALRLGSAEARQTLLQLLEASVSTKKSIDAIATAGEFGGIDCLTSLDRILNSNEPRGRAAALAAIGRIDAPRAGEAILRVYPRLDQLSKAQARQLLLSRREWARLTLLQPGREMLLADLQPDELRPAAAHADPELDAAVRRRWGTIRAGTPEEKLNEIRRLSNDLRASMGDFERGRELFKKHCATCHTFRGEGNKIGPDLTTANRTDREFMLVSIVDPSVQVRKEFQSYVLSTADGRVFNGLIAEQSASAVTLVGAKNERTTIARSDVDDLRESTTSLMPEKLLEPLKPQEVRDLFRYLESP